MHPVVPVAALLGTQALDVLTTWYGLSVGYVETNPIAAYAISTSGLSGLVLMSVLMVAWTAAGAYAVDWYAGEDVPNAWMYPVVGVAAVNLVAGLYNASLIMGWL